MKTFKQALEDAERIFWTKYWDDGSTVLNADAFKSGAQWAIQNLHLLKKEPTPT